MAAGVAKCCRPSSGGEFAGHRAVFLGDFCGARGPDSLHGVLYGARNPTMGLQVWRGIQLHRQWLGAVLVGGAWAFEFNARWNSLPIGDAGKEGSDQIFRMAERPASGVSMAEGALGHRELID